MRSICRGCELNPNTCGYISLECESDEYGLELDECAPAFEPDYDCGGDDIRFADPGGRSARRVGIRNLPCPTCGEPNKLTTTDVRLGYQCDECADAAERGW